MPNAVKQYKKGDIVAIIQTTVTQYAFGSRRPAETSQTIRIVRVESATADGATIKKYRTYPSSPVYPYENRYNRFKLMTIGGLAQENAARLFATATSSLDFIAQDDAKAAILAA